MIKVIQNKKIIALLFSILLVSNIFFIYKCIDNNKRIKNIEIKQETNKNIVSFALLFINKVLEGSKEISFDDRLQLETTVRNINDDEIYNSWKNFTKATNSTEVQKNFYNLFTVLLKKIES